MTQYPVFPWILTDYTSSSIDLNNPSVYRDLSKPIGALNPDRLATILERYEHFEDPDGIIPKFHYGTHYSTAAGVLYYAIRMEPFTTAAVELQGGHFDHTDRMFDSISQTWNSVLSNSADVKELIPEFFYFPEMFINSNNFDFGKKQKGGTMSDCVLPPWAASPYDFVRIHREALESEYVSQHLHHWIDLIFGYKQRGKPAESAHNLFYYLTYEGAVNIDAIDDPLQRHAFEKQIENFGQTPSQLTTRPHPVRKPFDPLMVSIMWHLKASSLHSLRHHWTQLCVNKTIKPLRHRDNSRLDLARCGVLCTPQIDMSRDFSLTARICTRSVNAVLLCTCRDASPQPSSPQTSGDGGQGCVWSIADGFLRFSITGIAPIQGQRSVIDELWHLVALTYSSSKNSVSLYFDGQLDAHKELPPNAMAFVEPSWPILVGAPAVNIQADFPVAAFDGSIHELVFHHTELDDQKVRDIATMVLMTRLYEPRPNPGRPHLNRLLCVQPTPDRILTVTQGLSLALHKWSPTSQNFSKHPFTFEADVLVGSRRKIGVPFSSDVNHRSQLFAATTDGRYLVSAGHWDNSFRVTNCDTGKVMGCVTYHKDVVTTVAVTLRNTVVVTGSRDTTVMVWSEEKGLGAASWDRPRNILYGHNDEITCVAPNLELDVVVSASLDGTCIIHTLRRGRYVRTIPHPASPAFTAQQNRSSIGHVRLQDSAKARNFAIHLVCVSNSGEIVMFSEGGIYMVSINGELLAHAETEERILCMQVTEGGEYLLTGGEKGVLVIRTLHNLQIIHNFPTMDAPLTCIAVTPEKHHVLVGLGNGTLCTFSLLPSESRKQSIITSLELIV
eukprot:c17284_g1_i1.p1 GENE.c17284_g1_i1~~c17284_g1_i1.p1  ORF type:complete len:899 (+),score=177.90 c17284_g1_i1:182-2698(+)